MRSFTLRYQVLRLSPPAILNHCSTRQPILDVQVITWPGGLAVFVFLLMQEQEHVARAAFFTSLGDDDYMVIQAPLFYMIFQTGYEFAEPLIGAFHLVVGQAHALVRSHFVDALLNFRHRMPNPGIFGQQIEKASHLREFLDIEAFAIPPYHVGIRFVRLRQTGHNAHVSFGIEPLVAFSRVAPRYAGA